MAIVKILMVLNGIKKVKYFGYRIIVGVILSVVQTQLHFYTTILFFINDSLNPEIYFWPNIEMFMFTTILL